MLLPARAAAAFPPLPPADRESDGNAEEEEADGPRDGEGVEGGTAAADEREGEGEGEGVVLIAAPAGGACIKRQEGPFLQ